MISKYKLQYMLFHVIWHSSLLMFFFENGTRVLEPKIPEIS